jgi:hypothetical protein
MTLAAEYVVISIHTYDILLNQSTFPMSKLPDWIRRNIYKKYVSNYERK